MKKAALEKLVPKFGIFFFSLKSIKWAGRWGRLYVFFQGPYTMRKYHIPQPQIRRRIEKSFAWVDHHLLRNGNLSVATHQDLALYLFLVLAADRNGVSFYRKEKICDTLNLDFRQFEIARDRLIEIKLIAFQGYTMLSPNRYNQVLPIEDKATTSGRQIIHNLTKQLTDKWNSSNEKNVQGISGDSTLEVLASNERLPYPDFAGRTRMSWLEIPMRETLRITNEVASQKGTGEAEHNQRNSNHESIESISALLWHRRGKAKACSLHR